MHHPHRPNTTGFTLIEALLVIGVVALLLAVLLPAVGRARGAARQAACVVRMKQAGDALLAYAVAESRFPRTDTPVSTARPWAVTLAGGGYLAGQPDVDGLEVMRCPDDPERVPFGYGEVGGELRVVDGRRPGSYGMNLYLDGDTVRGTQVRPTALSARAADVGLIAELAPDHTQEVVAPMFWGDNGFFDLDRSPGYLAARDAFADAGEIEPNSGDPTSLEVGRHGQTASFMFVDGSAAALEIDEVFDDPYDGPLDGKGQELRLESLINRFDPGYAATFPGGGGLQ